MRKERKWDREKLVKERERRDYERAQVNFNFVSWTEKTLGNFNKLRVVLKFWRGSWKSPLL
jgi:hypothetical protein